MHLFVLMPGRGIVTKWNYEELIKRIDFDYIKHLAPSSSFHCSFKDGTRHKFAKLCESIENEMQDALIFEVPDETEANILLHYVNGGNKLTKASSARSAYSYYYTSYEPELRYVFKDIDYDRMSTQAVFELLSKSDEKDKEKEEQKRKVKRLNSLKRDLEKFKTTCGYYDDLISTEFKDLVGKMAKEFTTLYETTKDDVKAERKEANKNKVSIRQKLAKFAVYNSRSKK